MKNIADILSVVVVCSLLTLLSSCSGSKPGAGAGAGKDLRPLQSVVVLPAETAQQRGQGKEDDSLSRGAAFIDLTVAEIMKDYGNVRVISAGQVESLMDEDNPDNSTDVIGHLGKILHCDAVMVITLHRYRQRVGGELASESPASASFQMRLVDPKNKSVLWLADFDETQESLFSNILTFNKAQRRGFKWITVETLVSQGLKDRFADCPFLQK